MDNRSKRVPRDRILDVAEREFMAHGYEGASMRMITSAAGVNLAAVNYYFQSKEGLLCAVFRRRLAWLNGERLAALDALEKHAGGASLKPAQVIEAFFGTLLRIGEDESLGGMTFLRLLGRTLTDPAEFIKTFFAREYAPVIARYKEALFRALPDVPPAEIVWRLHFMLGAMSYAIAGTDALEVITDLEIAELSATDETGHSDAPSQARRLAERLLPFLLGGLRAPLTTPASAASAHSAQRCGVTQVSLPGTKV